MDIKIAPRDEVAKYAKEMRLVLVALDHEEALVTDESTLSDFYLDEKETKGFWYLLGIEPMLENSKLVDVCKALRQRIDAQ